MVTSKAVVGSSAMSKSGVAAQGHGDHYPLPHPAGELMGIFPHPLSWFGDAYETKHFSGFCPGGLAFDILMQLDGFDNLFANGINRVEAGHGLLENHGDVVAADFSHLTFGKFQQVLTIKDYLTADNPAGGVRNQTQNRQARDTLAAAAFADNREGTSSFYFVTHVVDPRGLRPRR